MSLLRKQDIHHRDRTVSRYAQLGLQIAAASGRTLTEHRQLEAAGCSVPWQPTAVAFDVAGIIRAANDATRSRLLQKVAAAETVREAGKWERKLAEHLGRA